MKTTIKAVYTAEGIKEVAQLAKRIWNQHYVPIIGQAQVDYMVDKFQSERAIAQQIAEEEYEYYLILGDNKPVGYLGLRLQDNELFLSKYYVMKTMRGKGFGRIAMNFIIEHAQQNQAEAITLTVNKENTNSIAAYEKMGFINVGPVVGDIGNGYVMDDYAFRLPVPTSE